MLIRYCINCDHEFTNIHCPRCGGPPSPHRAPSEDEHGKHEPVVLNPGVSDPTDTLDAMIETASRPTLAQLLKRGVERGVITPTQEYSAGNVS